MFLAGALAMLRAVGERIVDCNDGDCRDPDCLSNIAYFGWFNGEPSNETLKQDRLDDLWRNHVALREHWK